MKKSVLFLTGILSAGIILSACGDRQTGGQRQENTAAEDNAASEETDAADNTNSSDDEKGKEEEEELTLNDPPETPPITIMDLSEEEVREELAQYPKFKVSENLFVNVPKEAQVLRYTSFHRHPTLEDTKAYAKGFQEIYDYIFPDHPMDEDYLYYISDTSDTEYDDDGNLLQDFKKVKDYRDEIFSGGEVGPTGSICFLYDESWHRQLKELDSEVCLMIPHPTGYGNGVLNKGKTLKLSGYKNEEGFCPNLYTFWPCDYLEDFVGAYQPDSKASFKLADKEVPICEAAAFVERYMNGLPYPKERTAETCVIGVNVYKVNADTYGYHFLTTRKYRGIPYDHIQSGSYTKSTKYSETTGFAFMVESNDIDAFLGYYQTVSVADYEICDKIIPFEEAAKIISGKLSDKPQFDVLNIEFVYLDERNKDEEGHVDISNYISKIKPAWKFTMYNPNDEYYYACFLDAADTTGKPEFTYYTTSRDLGFQK